MARVTIIEVAAAANVSKTTASDILRGGGRTYNESTAKLVRETAASLGYRPHAAARILRQSNSNIIGIAAGVRQRNHINNLVVAAHEECVRCGLQPVVFEPSHLLPEQNRSPFPGPESLAGILSIDLSIDTTLPDFYRTLSEYLPIVALYASGSREIDSISANWRLGIEQAVEHLMGLGHRHIAFAHDPESPYRIDVLRATSWRRCVERYNLDSTVASCATYRIPYPLAHVGEKLTNFSLPIVDFTNQIIARLQNAPVRPTALICTNDELAIALTGRLTTQGWKLPDELSIVGFYGNEYGEYACPRLTTIVPPINAIAAAGVARLQERIHANITGKQLPTCIEEFDTELLIRDSTTNASL